jgi:hypothetical protein
VKRLAWYGDGDVENDRVSLFVRMAFGAVVGLLIGLYCSGCAAAAKAVNTARDVEVSAGETLTKYCTDEYEKVETSAQLRNLDEQCMPARVAYGSLRAARLTALALLVLSEACDEGDEQACTKVGPTEVATALSALALAVESAAATAAALER